MVSVLWVLASPPPPLVQQTHQREREHPGYLLIFSPAKNFIRRHTRAPSREKVFSSTENCLNHRCRRRQCDQMME